MTKYNLNIKLKAYQMACKKVPLKIIQNELGPNPKAIVRYIYRFSKTKEIADILAEECKKMKAYREQ